MLRHLPLPAGLLPLLIADLALGALVAEDLDLAEGAVDGLVAAVVVAVGVDLQVQRQTLHPLLRGEVRAQAVDRDEDLRREEEERGVNEGCVKGVCLSPCWAAGRDASLLPAWTCL